MIRISLFLLILLWLHSAIFGQGISINTTQAPADGSAMLDVSSTTQGVLVPRMTSTERTAISSPATGLLVYDTTAGGFYYYNGTAWTAISTSSGDHLGNHTATANVQLNSNWLSNDGGNEGIRVDNAGNVGVGTSSPNDKLHVVGNARIDAGRLEFRNTGRSVFVGEEAGMNDDLTNNENVFVGYNTGKANTTGFYNAFFGMNAGSSNTTGSYNVGVGQSALLNTTTGTSNIALGWAALAANTTGSGNVALGDATLNSNTTGAGSTAVGAQAFRQNTQSANTALGFQAGYANTSGARNVFLGHQAGYNEAGSDKLYIDNSNTSSPLIWGDFSNNYVNVNGMMGVGTTSPGASMDITGNNIGTNSLQLRSGNLSNNTLSNQILFSYNGSTQYRHALKTRHNSNGSSGNAIDFYLWKYGTDGVGTVGTQHVMTLHGDGNVGINTTTPLEKLHVVGNIRIDGGRLDYQNTGASVFVGESAGENDNLSTHFNTYAGFYAGRLNTSGSENVAIGAGAMENNLTGSGNTFLGRLAGLNNLGSYNVFLGKCAGYNETGSNKLYIDNSITSSPLIWGDFANDYLNFNANVGIGTTTPGEKLDVVGKVKTTDFQMTNGATNSYVLQSDATGNASWVNPTSLSITESDPKVSSSTNGRVPRWNGSTLADGTIYDNGTNIGIGTTSPQQKLSISGGINIDQNNSNNGTFINMLSFGSTSGEGIGSARIGTVNQNGIDFYSNYTNRMAITNGGNIGIGTTSPTQKLEVSGTTKTTNLQMTSGAINGYVLQSDAAGNGTWVSASTLSITESDPQVSSSTTGYVPRWSGSALADGTIYDNGTNIGIGTTTPTQAKLVVNGSASYGLGSYRYYNSSTQTNGTASGNYSIYCSDRIAATEFNAFSDVRIKRVRGVSNSARDLETLSRIRITDYTFIDTVARGNKVVKKVIAQELAQVYPNAVSTHTDVVPDIYRMAVVREGNILLENCPLKAGERVKIIAGDSEKVVEVTEADSNSFRVTPALAPSSAEMPAVVFVYGREVPDFHTVDYEALSTLNISATQELLKHITALQTENALLKASVSSQDSRLQRLEAAMLRLTATH